MHKNISSFCNCNSVCVFLILAYIKWNGCKLVRYFEIVCNNTPWHVHSATHKQTNKHTHTHTHTHTIHVCMYISLFTKLHVYGNHLFRDNMNIFNVHWFDKVNVSKNTESLTTKDHGPSSETCWGKKKISIKMWKRPVIKINNLNNDKNNS